MSDTLPASVPFLAAVGKVASLAALLVDGMLTRYIRELSHLITRGW
jgi:hypothetical protein